VKAKIAHSFELINNYGISSLCTFFQVFRKVKQNLEFKDILIQVLLVFCAHSLIKIMQS
jgi:hypothetical protein